MKQKELERSLIDYTGGRRFINVSQLAGFLGVRRTTAADMVRGLDRLEGNRSKNYFINDVAAAIMAHRE